MYDVDRDVTERPRLMDFPLETRPLLHQNYLILGGGDGKVEHLRLDGGASEWLASLMGRILEQPVVAGGYLLATAPSGILMWDLAANAEFGRWSPKEPARLTSGAAGVGRRVYVGDSRGLLYSLSIDTCKPTWHRMMGAPVKGELTPVGTDLLILTGKPELICLDAAGSRAVRWRQEGVVKVLAIGKATVYALKADGAVAAFSMETGEQAWCDPVPADCKVTGDDSSPTIYIANPQGSVVAITELD
jgi:outer membrane protein assembly factor BamB